MNETEGRLRPTAMLDNAIKNDLKILIYLRNNTKIICNVAAYDKHYNLILRNCVEYNKLRNLNKGIKKKNGYEEVKNIGSIFLRGDAIILINIVK